MTSLRARLIVGFSLVAVLPLVLAMVLMGDRVRSAVRAQAADRLESAMGVVQGELQADGERLAARLALLARDPQLKRLYLVETAGSLGLRQYLADQRFLLGLDYLAIADTGGLVLADGANAPSSRSRPDREPIEAEALPSRRGTGVAVLALTGRPALALDATAGIPYLNEDVGLVRGGVLLDSLFLLRLQRTSGLDLVLRAADGQVLATTLASYRAGGAEGIPMGGTPPGRVEGGASVRAVFGGRPYLARNVALGTGAAPQPTLTALASTAAADDAVAALRVTALLLGLLGVLLAVALGMAWSHHLSKPVERLAHFSERISRGDWDEPLAVGGVRELRTLVDALERMRTDLRRYRDRLRAGERQAAYGQMARKVAHEIKNPLTPIAVSVAALKRSYDQKHPDFGATLDEAVRTVGEEVQRLKNLLQEFSDLGRFPNPVPARFAIGELLADLRGLYAHEVTAGRLAFDWPEGALTLTADRDQVRQALINLIQNGLDATAAGAGQVRVSAQVQGATLRLEVRDDGPGLAEEQRAQLFVPGFTTKAHGSGLGLTIVERIVSDHGGSIEVVSSPGRGTAFVVQLALEQGA